jgi:hypothetical protein
MMFASMAPAFDRGFELKRVRSARMSVDARTAVEGDAAIHLFGVGQSREWIGAAHGFFARERDRGTQPSGVGCDTRPIGCFPTGQDEGYARHLLRPGPRGLL